MPYKYLDSEFLVNSESPKKLRDLLRSDDAARNSENLKHYYKFVSKRILPYKKQLDDLLVPDTPPWMHKRVLESITIIFEPILCQLTFALQISSIHSIEANLSFIINYVDNLVSNKKNHINLEFKTWQMMLWCAIHGKIFDEQEFLDGTLDKLFAESQNDNSTECKPSSARDSNLSYIGFPTTKQDAVWLAKVQWQNTDNQECANKKSRQRKSQQFLRQRTIRWLSHYNLKDADILDILQHCFPDEATNGLETTHINNEASNARRLLITSPFRSVYQEFTTSCKKGRINDILKVCAGEKLFDLQFDEQKHIFHIIHNK